MQARTVRSAASTGAVTAGVMWTLSVIGLRWWVQILMALFLAPVFGAFVPRNLQDEAAMAGYGLILSGFAVLGCITLLVLLPYIALCSLIGLMMTTGYEGALRRYRLLFWAAFIATSYGYFAMIG
jgi:hypothetical protein